ncbi:MAG: hypothetical protein ACUVWK_05625 [Nitrososphaerales archaeon]
MKTKFEVRFTPPNFIHEFISSHMIPISFVDECYEIFESRKMPIISSLPWL